ncbi:MAG TPA: hypothetical protein PK677_05915 [Acidiphilium sp.]|nr:MAG: hypothetical protein B7Z67_01430 [Acidiphilium sp. 21-60-14]OYV91825.1 MAG: hypothetical protein B7Z57_03185 [Acidiphilium sp. 37-60-79]OZB41273.1 MAG: hypothetical protein B7X48_01110 [Acidiphilium sp. 34-60-192]HQT88074.1 hypothetical protein [Acidiphilium sp.]HQU23010.1 hypothetical protein [Acidiphilium sp.]
MKKLSLLSLPAVILLAACSSGSGAAPTTPAAAKASSAAYLAGLPAPQRETALFCQSQAQIKLGGTVYLESAPALLSTDVTTNFSPNVLGGKMTILYDRVDGSTVTNGVYRCDLNGGKKKK